MQLTVAQTGCLRQYLLATLAISSFNQTAVANTVYTMSTLGVTHKLNIIYEFFSKNSRQKTHN